MPKQIDNENVYPAGDQPPAPTKDEDKNQSGKQGQGNADTKNQGKQTDSKGNDQDNNKGGEDWENRYKNLEKKLGEQGNEMGQLKQQNQQLMEQLEGMKAGDQGKGAGDQQAPDYEAKMNDIYKQLDTGDISVEEAMRQSNALTNEMASKNAESKASEKVQQALEEKEQEAQLNKFFEQHPDFQQLKESGQLENVKAQMPGFHDDFSAYFAYKAQTAADEAYNRGKQEMEQLSQGDANTDKVLQGPGSAIRNQNPEPLTDEGDIKQSMMQRLKEARNNG